MTDTHEKFIERVRAYAEKATFVKLPVHARQQNNDEGFDLLDADGDWFGELSPCYDDDQGKISASGHALAALVVQSLNDLPAALDIIETLVRERDEARQWKAIADAMNEALECYCVPGAEWTCRVCLVRIEYKAAVAAMKGVPSE